MRTGALGSAAAIFLLSCGGAHQVPKPAPIAVATAAPSASTVAATQKPAPSASASVATTPPKKPTKRPLGFRGFRPRKPIGAFPARDSVDEHDSIDLDSVPLANAVDVGTDLASFTLKRFDLTPRCPTGSSATTRVTFSLDLFSALPMLMKVGNVVLPPKRFLDGLHETNWLTGIPQTGQTSASWMSLARAKGEDAVDITTFEGSYDGAAHRAAARSKTTVHAAGISSRGVYAFRRCLSKCDSDPGEREEELTLIGPPALWVASSEESIDHTIDKRTAFTRVSVPFHSGTSATLEIVAFDDDIAQFKNGQRPLIYQEIRSGNDHWTTFSLEVVWEEGSDPSLDLFVFHSSGAPSAVRDDLSTLFEEPPPSAVSVCRKRYRPRFDP